jgi:hypothetical protein
MSRPLKVGGQQAFVHDEGHPAGTFHTYDALDVSDVSDGAGGGFPPRKVHVFLPRRPSIGPMPVVYMHDGNTAFWPGGVAHSCWDVADAVARAGKNVIVVAIHPHDRNAEYTHVDWSGGRRPWGKLPDYATYVSTRLVPFIDAHYPSDPRPAARAVVGSSHGGLASFYIATRHPDVFGFAGCMSPSFFSGIEPPPYGPGEAPLRDASIVADVFDDVLTDVSRRPKVWMCWGLRRDGGDHNSVVEHLATKRGREMATLLADVGYDHHAVADAEVPRADATLWTRSDRRGGHDETSWGARLPLLLRAFIADERPLSTTAAADVAPRVQSGR